MILPVVPVIINRCLRASVIFRIHFFPSLYIDNYPNVRRVVLFEISFANLPLSTRTNFVVHYTPAVLFIKMNI
ncbi:hypothetical protein EBL_c22570 [Shimwellia blattae DSM 4481 = NBRC 105725]|uniref:Uncharacterized protein n=1 Tax=Shimwellia blattae (strain ATCC 29907 / DSM 4481 / JCM 1650 / NBRC 105725 / CDC 9005-74) TaxID=630626 RepID=I2B9Z4_SHIBC|nr:hypothetical protein EBL_c22570 [Shimwellia blattae DSM 4481 = NBRC 105725]